jgi:hypothetical protein
MYRIEIIDAGGQVTGEFAPGNFATFREAKTAKNKTAAPSGCSLQIVDLGGVVNLFDEQTMSALVGGNVQERLF